MSRIDQTITAIQGAASHLSGTLDAIAAASAQAGTAHHDAAVLGANAAAEALATCVDALDRATAACAAIEEALQTAQTTASSAVSQPATPAGAATVKPSGPVPRIKLPDPPFFANPSTLRGVTREDVERQIPAGYEAKPLKKGSGVRYLDPTKPGVGVYIEDGWPGAVDALHAGPYVKITTGRGPAVRIPLAGNPVLRRGERGYHSPDAG